MNKKTIIGIIALLTAGLLLYQLGRGVYMPIIQLLQGKETTETAIQKLEKNATERLQPHLNQLGLERLPDSPLLVGLKEEQVLEVYVPQNQTFQLLKSYPFTAFSGRLGPKLQEGDKQIPEGIYKIDYLNPNSAYHLSMKINFPNDFDISKSTFTTPQEIGSNIFIHGKAVTIGCIPIGDKAIEELFLLAQNAFDNGIKVIISPRDFRKNNTMPEIAGITWEQELYRIIQEELQQIKVQH